MQQTTQYAHDNAIFTQPVGFDCLRTEMGFNQCIRLFCIKCLSIERRENRIHTLFQKALQRGIGHSVTAEQGFAGQKTSHFAEQFSCGGRRGRIYFTRGNICKAYAARSALGKQAAQKVIAAFIQHRCLNDRTRRDHAHNIALDQSLGGLGVFYLLANRHLITLAHQATNIAFAGVIGHAAHGRTLFLSAVAAGQRQFQFTRDQNGIVKEHLIKIAQTIKQNIIAALLLDLEVLLHHWG